MLNMSNKSKNWFTEILGLIFWLLTVLIIMFVKNGSPGDDFLWQNSGCGGYPGVSYD